MILPEHRSSTAEPQFCMHAYFECVQTQFCMHVYIGCVDAVQRLKSRSEILPEHRSSTAEPQFCVHMYIECVQTNVSRGWGAIVKICGFEL